jgi:hypothetical protein
MTIAKTNSAVHPTWAKIAQDYLPIQGSAVPCKRVFSSGGITGTDCWNRLTPQMFECLQLLKHVYSLSMMTVLEEPSNGDLLEEWFSDSESEESLE